MNRCFGTPSRHQPNSYTRRLLNSSWVQIKKKKQKKTLPFKDTLALFGEFFEDTLGVGGDIGQLPNSTDQRQAGKHFEIISGG